MKVIVSVAGRFHIFRTAEQLERKKVLSKLITTEPLRNEDQIPIKKVKRLKSLGCLFLYEKIALFLPQVVNNFFPYIYLKRHELYSKRVAKIIKRTDADVFISSLNQGWEAAAVAKKKGMVTIAICGNTYIGFYREILREEYKLQKMTPPPILENQNVFKRGVKEVEMYDYLLVASKFVRDSFPKKYQKKLLLIPTGVDHQLFPNYPKTPTKKFIVLWVGTICIRKGVHYLLKAFTELKLPNAELLLVGFVDNDFRPILKKYKNNKNIKLVGPVKQNKLHKYYNLADIFVHPSIEEGLSLVILEALASSLPVITTTNTGACDLITNHQEGYIVPIRNANHIKQRLSHLYYNKHLLPHMQRQSHLKSLSYSWAHYGDKLYDILQKIVIKKQLQLGAGK